MMGVRRRFRNCWLSTVLVFSICLLWISATTAAPAPDQKVPGAPEAPQAIPGYWLQQRLGTPDKLLTFLDADHGWASSSVLTSGIYRTADGGVTWQVYSFGQQYDTFRVSDAFFVSSLEGWATGRRDYYDLFMRGIFIAHTTDGGATWQQQISTSQSDEVWAAGESIWFVDGLHGWVEAGEYLWRTTNGAGWTRLQPANMPDRLLRFINATTGFGVTGQNLMRTIDGGATWSGAGVIPAWANAVWIGGGGSIVWAVGEDGRIARSPNTGASWTPISSPTSNRLSHLSFVNSQVGWAAGDAGTVLATTDGGLTWVKQSVGSTATITSLAAGGTSGAWIFADMLRRTLDGGARWTSMRTVDANRLNAVRMASSSAGWAGGARPAVLHTTDAGRRWIDQNLAVPSVTTLDVVDEMRAWALSGSALQRTTDGGGNWSYHNLPISSANDMDFVSTTRGWLVGEGSIYRTTDAGLNWTPQYTSADSYQIKRVSFVDAQRGWVLATRGQDRLMLRTTDGGTTWNPVAGFGLGDYSGPDISFVDATHGWGIDGGYVPSFSPGHIARTTNGGTSWQVVRGAGIGDPSEFYTAVDFLNTTEGWVVGSGGLILYTQNAGDTWQIEYLASRLTLRGVHAVGPGLAWIVGDGGLILEYSATQPPGCWATPTPAPAYSGVPPAEGSVERQVSHCMDDTYVRVDTEELLYDREYVRMGAREGGSVPYVDGFLFRDMRIPNGAQILSARLRLRPQGSQSGVPIVVTLAGEAHGQSGDFNPQNWWAHLRPRTNARVPWTLTTTVTGMTESPDISSIVQEIVALPGWRPGNNLAVLVDAAEGGQQFINWWAFDGKPSDAAELVISYRSAAPRSRLFLPLVLRN